MNAQSIGQQRVTHRLLANLFASGHPYRCYCGFETYITPKEAKERDSFRDLNADGRIILKRILKRQYNDKFQVYGSREHGKEHLGFTNIFSHCAEWASELLVPAV
jgi:retron-type reverse transcriptase